MQANEAAWYDEHYRKEQASWAPWYKFSLPFLRQVLTPQTRLVELGCGQGHLLRHLGKEQLLPQENIYGLDQTGLGTLVASFALGSFLGSIGISLAGRALRPARMMLMFAVAWYAALLAFVQMQSAVSGRMVLVIAGVTQSLSLVPMSVMLLHSAGERFRGRVMGVRMLAIYGVPIGLLAAGVLIERLGFAATASLYCAIGIGLTGLIALRWRADLWPIDAPANTR